MGQFDGPLLDQQQVVLAWLDDRLMGFVSFHAGRTEWSLDLMRHDASAPSGTMHALVAAGIGAARAAGMGHVSLAAVQLLPGRLARLTDVLPGAAGLRQFKRSFAPVWRPLYLCTPRRTGSLWAIAAITWAIHRPGHPFGMSGFGVRVRGGSDFRNHSAPHHHLENIQIENALTACEGLTTDQRRAKAALAADPRPRTGPKHARRAKTERPFPPA